MPYIACEQYRFDWTDKDLKIFRTLWRQGVHIADIAEKLRRKPAEVAFLVIDQADRNKIGQRPGACWGEPKKFTPAVREMMVANRF